MKIEKIMNDSLSQLKFGILTTLIVIIYKRLARNVEGEDDIHLDVDYAGYLRQNFLITNRNSENYKFHC